MALIANLDQSSSGVPVVYAVYEEYGNNDTHLHALYFDKAKAEEKVVALQANRQMHYATTPAMQVTFATQGFIPHIGNPFYVEEEEVW